MGIPVYHPSNLHHISFDQILIASSFVNEINQVLAQHGLPIGLSVEELPDLMLIHDAYEHALYIMRSRNEDLIPQIALAQQNIDRANLLTDRISLLNALPRGGTVAEIGVAAGDFSRQILEISNPATFHLIDSWDSERYGEALYNKVNEQFTNEQTKGQVRLHRQTSLDAVEQFPDNYFDWVYIDTTHSYQLTRDELRHYANKIKPNGFLVGHDYIQGNWCSQYRYGVMEAVHEFCVEFGFRIRYLTMNMAECQSFAIEKI